MNAIFKLFAGFIGLTTLATVSFSQAQDRYAVVVGVEKYNPSSFEDLKYAEDDAAGLAQAFNLLGYNTTIMTAANARTPALKPYGPANILKTIQTVAGSCLKGDTLIVSLSGHGVQFEDEEPLPSGIYETYFCPESADIGDKTTLLPVSQIMEVINNSEATRKLLLIDACREQLTHEGEANSRGARKIKLDAVHENRESVPGGMAVMFSCKSSQLSWEHDSLEHSVFSHFVISYLQGKADERFYDQGKLTLDGLAYYVRKKTNQFVFENNICADGQSPVLHSTSEEWPLAATRPLASYSEFSSEKLMQHVELEYAAAQHELGLRYAEGRDVAQDYAEALKYFEAAAEQGFAPAAFSVAFIYDYGMGVEIDYTEAMNWYKIALEMGEERANAYIAFLYNNGMGVEQNTEEARKWFEKGCAANDPIAMIGLANLLFDQNDSGQTTSQIYDLINEAIKTDIGELPEDLDELMQGERKDLLEFMGDAYSWMGYFYEHGIHVDASNQLAMDWYLKSTELNDYTGQYLLGSMYLYVDEFKNMDQAIHWLKLSADQEYSPAMNELGQIYQDDSSKLYNPAAAFEYFSRSAELGNNEGIDYLGDCYHFGVGTQVNISEAIRLYRISAEAGVLFSMNSLGYLYDSGEGVTLNDAEAVKWYRKAAELGLDVAQFNLAMMYLNGEGIGQDVGQAKIWFQKAADQGYESAQKELANLK